MRIVAEGLWKEIHKLATRKGPKLAAVAYVTSDKHVRFGRGDTLVTDASDKAIEGGQTSVDILRRAYDRGADLYSYQGLHAKVYAFDREVVIGSSNLSASSENLLEVAAITKGARAVASASFLIEELKKHSKKIDSSFLAHASSLKVRPAWMPSKKSKKGPKLPKVPVWLVAVTELDDTAFPKEQARAESGRAEAAKEHRLEPEQISWIRYRGSSRFVREARKGHIAIQFWTSGPTGKQVTVYRPAPILRRQNEPMCTRFYLRDFEDVNDTSISFSEFSKLWRRAGATGKLSRCPTRLVTERDADRLLAAWEGE